MRRRQSAASRVKLFVALAFLVGCSTQAAAPRSEALQTRAVSQVEQSQHGMVVSGSPIASRVGAAILEQGGNAVDAAVATAFALSVVEPTMSGLGGRTQMLIRTRPGEFVGLDGTTEVPAGYPAGAVPADENAYGYTTIAIPGTVAVLATALERHGTMSLAAVLQPAIDLAEKGFALPADEAGRLASVAARLAEFEGSRQYFLRADGAAYGAGEIFVQPDLGRTLRTIANDGAAAFYHGPIATAIAADMERNRGFVTAADLAAYRADPALLVRGSYRGIDITGTYLPASGATTIEILQILEHFDLPSITGSPRWAGLLASALLLGFADRTADLGPPAEHAATITSKTWAARRAREIRVPAMTPPSVPQQRELEPAHTTHLSVADAAGGVVALTQSVGPIMGSKVAAPGLGFVYAATMGYLGSLQPGERPFSSQSPLILERDGELAYVVGAAGARRIISALVAMLSRAIDEQLALPDAMAAPRLHATESAIDMEVRPAAMWSPSQLRELSALGFTVRERTEAPYFGRINAIGYDPVTRTFTGVSDPRWTGAAAAPRCPAPCDQPADVLLLGGRVLDGAGNPWQWLDVGVTGDRITFVGNARASRITARDTLRVDGLLVAPGFWDVHSHATLETDEGRYARAPLYQGITTVVLGMDGNGSADIADIFESYRSTGIALNAVRFVGHANARSEAMGVADRAPTPRELQQMKDYVRRGMEQGAVGLSTGLFYSPGFFAETDEVVELARVAAEYGGIYDTHDRDLGAAYKGIGYHASVREGIEIGERAGLPVVFSHFNPQGAHLYGRAAEGVQLIEEARARGVNVMAGQHVYTATHASLSAYAMPRWAVVGGSDAMLERFADPDTRRRIQTETLEMLEIRGGAGKIIFTQRDPELNGRSLADVAQRWNLSVPDAVMRILSVGNASVMNMDLYDDANTRLLARQEWMMTCTDGYTPSDLTSMAHPRSYGAFTRKLRLFALEDSLISLPFAVRGMTALAASFYGFPQRGQIREGFFADIAVLDLDRLHDPATYEQPHQLAEGTVHVLVNGQLALRDGRATGVLAGRPLPRERGHAGPSGTAAAGAVGAGGPR